MKPENAFRLTTEGVVLCLASVSLEWAMEEIQSRHKERNVKHVWQFVSVSKAGLWSASHLLQSYGIPVRVVDHYDIDEWSLTAIGLTSDGQIVKDEAWSPG